MSQIPHSIFLLNSTMEDVKGNVLSCPNLKEEMNNIVSVNFDWQIAELNYMNNNGQQNGHQSNLANKRASKYRKASIKNGQNGNNPAICSPIIWNRKSGKRKKSSDKEKQTQSETKKRLKELNQMMPFVAGTNLTTIRVLRLTNKYIEHLGRMLQGEFVFCQKTGQLRPLQKEDFAQTVNLEMQIKNSYSDRIEEEINDDQKINRREYFSSTSKIFNNGLANCENGQNLK